jgi:hypothetical protein
MDVLFGKHRVDTKRSEGVVARPRLPSLPIPPGQYFIKVRTILYAAPETIDR